MDDEIELDDKKEINFIFKEFVNKVQQLLIDGYSPLAIAGVMSVQSISLYKNSMDEEDFNKMMDTIFAEAHNETSNIGKVLH
jgi:hypothetical protein